MLVYEYKLSGSRKQYAAIEDAIRVVQFMTRILVWVDGEKVSKNDLQTNCSAGSVRTYNAAQSEERVHEEHSAKNS